MGRPAFFTQEKLLESLLVCVLAPSHAVLTLRKSRNHDYQEAGSFSLEESLVELVRLGHIAREDALLHALHPDDVAAMLRDRARK